MTIDAATPSSTIRFRDRVTSVLANLGERWDVVLGAILLVGVAIMLIPLPTFLVDLLISLNIALTLVILLVAFYIKNPLQFSSFPAVILLATLLRLALTISTTRLILLNGDAGEIIATFGNFVVAGSVGVGLIIFLLITVVQFIVVTKGAERIAEVAARFSLDALPGRQMAIDADLRAGDIDKVQAKNMRAQLARESQFNGAMDGAMKFVKGDAIAGIIIVAVNLIGGISIGVVGKGMAFGDAVHTYSLLTIGDGLIAQIPSLLIAISAGAVVSRVVSDQAGGASIGNDIARQLSSEAVPIAMAAGALALIGLLPGFPTLIFWFFAGLLGLAAWLSNKRAKENLENNAGSKSGSTGDSEAGQASDQRAHADSDPQATAPVVGPQDVISIALGKDLRETFQWVDFAKRIDKARVDLVANLGINLGNIGLSDRRIERGDAWQILSDGAVSASGTMSPNYVATNASMQALDALGAERSANFRLPDGTQWFLVDQGQASDLERIGASALGLNDLLATAIGQSAKRLAPSLVGIQETAAFLREAETNMPDLVAEVRGRVPLQRITDVLRQLLEDGVSVSHSRLILEGIGKYADRTMDAVTLAELVRQTLSRPISQAASGQDGSIPALILRDDVEQVFRYLQPTGGRTWLGENEMSSLPRLLANLRTAVSSVALERPAVLVCSPDVRRKVQATLQAAGLELQVLSTSDINPDFPLQPLGTVGQ
jgi:type III secretion protein V